MSDKITVGIDIGGSTTKITGLKNGGIISPLMVRATDPLAALFGAFGKFVDGGGLALSDIGNIFVTGVGASFLEHDIYGIKTVKRAEFSCNGLGGLHLSGLEKAVVVSMGTGTSIVLASADGAVSHLGGTGVGGGTIMGLANRLLNVRDIDIIIEMAKGGNLRNVDLCVSDITKDVLPTLTAAATASNFGRISDVAAKSDIALGIFNLVFQSIGMTAVFASKSTNVNDIVLIGNLSVIPEARGIFSEIGAVSGANFIFPPNCEFSTAVGAALSKT